MRRIALPIWFALLAAESCADGLACAAEPPPELMVSAASSLRDALSELRPEAERELGLTIVFNFGASNDLARQIVAGGKSDVFISADEAWMDHVTEAGLIDGASRRPLLSNLLVVVIPSDSRARITGPLDLAHPGIRRLALANPEAVPAGRYARAWLEKSGVWDAIRDRVVPTVDVRAALAAVESGAVDAAIVYRTDAISARSARLAYTVDREDGPRIVYAAAVIASGPQHDAAGRYLGWLGSERPRAVFERWGFIIISSDGGTGR